MDDNNRLKLDDEISRLHDTMKVLSPDSGEYEKISDRLVKLTELANKDDEAKNKFDVDHDRLDLEASLEQAKRGIESERLESEARIKEAEAEMKKQEAKRSYIQLAISGAITLVTFVGTWIANAHAQNKSEYFEATGHGYTSKFSRWQNKEPIHPNPLLRNMK